MVVLRAYLRSVGVADPELDRFATAPRSDKRSPQGGTLWLFSRHGDGCFGFP